MRAAGHDALVAVASDAALASGVEDGERGERRVGTGVAVRRKTQGRWISRGRNISKSGFDIAEVVVETSV